MAATAWSIYNKAKKSIGNGTIQLGTNVVKIQLHTSASNASTFTISTAASVTSEVSNANGYVTGGKSAASPIWTTGASAKQYKFNTGNVTWNASGGNIASIKFAVFKNSAGKLICWSRLSTAQFTVNSGNSISINMNASGIFTLV
jgi:hypothetical protein